MVPFQTFPNPFAICTGNECWKTKLSRKRYLFEKGLAYSVSVDIRLKVVDASTFTILF